MGSRKRVCFSTRTSTVVPSRARYAPWVVTYSVLSCFFICLLRKDRVDREQNVLCADREGGSLGTQVPASEQNLHFGPWTGEGVSPDWINR